MAYSRGQPSFVGAVDSRDGFDYGAHRTQNDVHTQLSRQPINIPVIAMSGSRYSSATYPGFRGSAAVDRDGFGRQQANSVAAEQSVSPVADVSSSKSYRSSVSTQVSSSGQVPLHTGTKNLANDATMSHNSASSYVGATSSLPNRKRSDGSVVPVESYPMPVSSQIVYTSRMMPGGPSGVAGKVAVVSSRRAAHQPGIVSDAAPVSKPQLRQIPVVVVPSQTTSGEAQNQRIFHHSKSYQEPSAVSPTNKGTISPESRSRSFDPSYLKEAEVDALTDLLVQNMNVAGNPDFCGIYFCIII